MNLNVHHNVRTTLTEPDTNMSNDCRCRPLSRLNLMPGL